MSYTQHQGSGAPIAFGASVSDFGRALDMRLMNSRNRGVSVRIEPQDSAAEVLRKLRKFTQSIEAMLAE